MKKIVVFLLLTAFTGMMYAQKSNCVQPLPSLQFQQKYNQIKNKPTEGTRLQIAKQIVKSYCFSSAQIKELASLFENDFDRFEFAKIAYKNTTDKEIKRQTDNTGKHNSDDTNNNHRDTRRLRTLIKFFQTLLV